MQIDLRKDEEVVEVVRKSMLMLIPKIFKGIALIIPGFFTFLYFDLPIVTVISFGWIIIVLSYFLYIGLIWHSDCYVLTTKRVIELNYRSLFKKEINELPYEKLEEIGISVEGLEASLLGIGTLKLYSRSSLLISLSDIQRPKEIKELLEELKKSS